MRRAFTMIELVFVIVVIGILSMIAIPKFAATRDDAIVTKAKTTVANIRAALSSEVQAKMLRGDYNDTIDLGGNYTSQYDKPIFDYFDGNTSGSRILEYAPRSCKDSNKTGCWIRTDAKHYKFIMPSGVGGYAVFKVDNNRFDCETNSSSTGACRKLER